MSVSELYCPDDARLDALRAATLRPANAIDHVDVLPSQRVLAVHCLEDVGSLDERNAELEGGVRIGAHVISVHRGSDLPSGLLDEADAAALPTTGLERVVVVRTDTSGDFSTYTIRLVSSGDPTQPPPGFDPILSTARFSFKVDCPSDFDCRTEVECADRVIMAPRIDYLAKDYASFRRLMLDRLAQTLPAWRERNPLDLGVTLVELIAFEADRISYYQDAVATEAYLGSARLRPSVRRHARLVDYHMTEGAAARAWIALEASSGTSGVVLPAGTRLLPEDVRLRRSTDPADNLPLEEAVASGAVVFETLHDATLAAARNAIAIHTWGDPRCCLPKGATGVTLRGRAPDLSLRRGDVLIIERVDPAGRPLSADRERHVVRLIGDGVAGVDPLGGLDVTEVQWHPEDALPFPITLDERADGVPVGVVRANVVLAEHGLTVRDEKLRAPVDRRFRPVLTRPGITHAVPYHHATASDAVEPALRATSTDPSQALAKVELHGEGQVWAAERELLRAGPFSHRFVVEMDEGNRGRLRFGDGVNGRRPGRGQLFEARYRIGNGPAGNVGADTLTQLYPAPGGVIPTDVSAARNPLPASGGVAPEPLERARVDAPEAFRRQERAVTEADYAEAAERHREVQKAAATRRWTGSWYTMFVTVDRVGGLEVDAAFEQRLLRYLDRFRLAGYDIEVDGPRYVALDLALEICVAPGFVASEVERAVRSALAGRQTQAGSRGLFHPDHRTFGQPVFLSAVVATSMRVQGVEQVVPTRFQRWRGSDHGELETRAMEIARLEIARLDDDPSRPEMGRLDLVMRGGA
jgi:hypothetical protein